MTLDYKDTMGRKNSMIMVNIPFALGWFMLYRATEVWEIFGGFAMLGMAIGLMEAGKWHAIELITKSIIYHNNDNILACIENPFKLFFSNICSSNRHIFGRIMVSWNLIL